MRTRFNPVTCAVLALAIAGCSGDDNGTDPGDDTERYTASLTADAVVIEDVVSSATGTAQLEYDGTILSYSIEVSGMDSVTAAHIHGPATPTVTAPVRLTLFNPAQPTGVVNGQLVSGTAGAGSSQLASGITMADIVRWIRNDSAFVMVHSVTYRDGEIRGQIVPE